MTRHIIDAQKLIKNTASDFRGGFSFKITFLAYIGPAISQTRKSLSSRLKIKLFVGWNDGCWLGSLGFR